MTPYPKTENLYARDETTHGRAGELLGGRQVGKEARVLFLDDFMCSGSTRRRCQDAVEKAGAVLIASYWYRDNYYHEEVPRV